MAKVLAEFREFAVKGSVIDLAVGVIIGAAFTTIVKSLVDDVIMPFVGLATGGIDMANRYWVVSGIVAPGTSLVDARGTKDTVIVAWGHFLNNVLIFLIVAWVVFLFVKGINRMRRSHARAPATPMERACPECLTSILNEAKRCKACGASVSPILAPPTSS